MDHLRYGKHKSSKHLLKQAEQALIEWKDQKKASWLFGMTYNNMGWYYKRRRYMSQALKYFKKAIQYQGESTSDKINVAGTHLNICVIQSHMSNHEAALENAYQALAILESCKVKNSDIPYLSSLILSYYNIGVEYEKLGTRKYALKNYSAGYELAQKHFPPNHTLIVKLRKNIESIQDKNRIVANSQRRIDGRARSRWKPNITENNRDIELRTAQSNRAQTSFSNKSTPAKQIKWIFKTSDSVLNPKISARNERFTERKWSQDDHSRRRVNMVRKSLRANNWTISPSPPPPREKTTTPLPTRNNFHTITNSINSIENKIDWIEKKMSTTLNPRSPDGKSQRLEPLNRYRHNPRNSAAIVIQRFWKGYLTRRMFDQARMDLKSREQSAQQTIRELEELKRETDRLKEQINVQKQQRVNVVRGIRERQLAKFKSFRQKPMETIPEETQENRTDKIIHLQNSIRKYLARKNFL